MTQINQTASSSTNTEIETLKATSSAQIHSDGDFIATMEIDISTVSYTHLTLPTTPYV